tara:strand:- start:78 stop:1607 length:1530 start_codon:yes stop_codon:yes gene_type:complete
MNHTDKNQMTTQKSANIKTYHINGFSGSYKKVLIEIFVPDPKFCLCDILKMKKNLRPNYLRNICPHSIKEIKSIKLYTRRERAQIIAPVIFTRPDPYDFIYRPKKDDGHGMKLPMNLIKKILKMRPCFNKQLQKKCDTFKEFKEFWAVKYPTYNQTFNFSTWIKWRKAEKKEKKRGKAAALRSIKMMCEKFANYRMTTKWKNLEYTKFRDAPKAQFENLSKQEANRIAWYYEERRQLHARGVLSKKDTEKMPKDYIEKCVRAMYSNLSVGFYQGDKIKNFSMKIRLNYAAEFHTTRKSIEASFIKEKIKSIINEKRGKYRYIIKVIVAGFKHLSKNYDDILHLSEDTITKLMAACGCSRRWGINIIELFIMDQMRKLRDGSKKSIFYYAGQDDEFRMFRINKEVIYRSPLARQYPYLKNCGEELALPFHSYTDGVRFVEMLNDDEGYDNEGYCKKWIDGNGAFKPKCFIAAKLFGDGSRTGMPFDNEYFSNTVKSEIKYAIRIGNARRR